MDINLQYVEDFDWMDSDRAILNVLKATLQYPANPQAKGVKLADDMHFFYTSQKDGTNFRAIFWRIWWVVVDIVYCIPPGHPCQDSLVLALQNLRQREDTVSKQDQSATWENLPDLSIYIRDKWCGTEPELSHVSKNLNSFIARLTSTGFAPWLNLPIWELREALEEPPEKGPAMACRVWVATEWIIHCADRIFMMMNSKEELDEFSLRSFRLGSLCDEKPVLSVERWEFGKKRFVELAADTGSRGFDSAISGRISDALKIMDTVKE
ncbi:hypothetical protein B0O99DRAFT_684487 [Bisporella sp. PMI_857]|nr:hypothetical protein B0O99DRAFT_684487 [Bisporella sp. PMI_857]